MFNEQAGLGLTPGFVTSLFHCLGFTSLKGSLVFLLPCGLLCFDTWILDILKETERVSGP